MTAKIPLVLAPQPEGGYTVTSPLLPELITEGDTMAGALANVEDAFGAVVEIYEERGRPLPSSLYVEDAEKRFRRDRYEGCCLSEIWLPRCS